MTELEQFAAESDAAPPWDMWSSTYPALCEAGDYVE